MPGPQDLEVGAPADDLADQEVGDLARGDVRGTAGADAPAQPRLVIAATTERAGDGGDAVPGSERPLQHGALDTTGRVDDRDMLARAQEMLPVFRVEIPDSTIELGRAAECSKRAMVPGEVRASHERVIVRLMSHLG